MIDPITMLAIGAGTKALLGVGQALFSGRKRAEPKYEIPKEVEEAVGLARGMAAEGMPEAQRMAALQNIQQSAVQAGRTAAMAGRGAMLGSMGNIQAQQDRSVLNLASQDAAMRQQNQRFMYSALRAKAQDKDKAFANQWQSWMNEEQRRRALRGASMQNIGGAVDTMMGGMIQLQSILGTDKVQDDMNQITPTSERIPISGALSRAISRPTMPSVPQPSYGFTPSQMTSRGIFQSLIRR